MGAACVGWRRQSACITSDAQSACRKHCEPQGDRVPLWMLSLIWKAKNARAWVRKNPEDARILAYTAVLVTLCVLAMGATVYVARLRDRMARVQLEKSNAIAALDTTRVVALSAKDRTRLLGDSLQMVQRLAVQVTQQRDSVDKALHQTSMAKVQLQLAVDSLRVKNISSTAPVVINAAGERTADFHVRKEPYTVDASVALPAVGAGRLVSLGVRLDSASLHARLGCGDAVDGVRPAQVTLTTPAWLRVRVTKAEQDPAVCNAALGEKPRSHWRPALAVGPSYNAVRLPDGTIRTGWGASVQLSLLHWP